MPARYPVLFHPDYTVGPGIAPDLLTLLLSGRSIEVEKSRNFS